MIKFLTIPALVCALIFSGAAMASEKRCGWYDNPTPANAWLFDKDGQWIIATQMGKQAEGNWSPEFKEGEKIYINGSYGYGCACLEVETDSTNSKEKRIVKVISTETKPLSICKNDKKLSYKKDIYDGIQHKIQGL